MCLVDAVSLLESTLTLTACLVDALSELRLQESKISDRYSLVHPLSLHDMQDIKTLVHPLLLLRLLLYRLQADGVRSSRRTATESEAI